MKNKKNHNYYANDYLVHNCDTSYSFNNSKYVQKWSLDGLVNELEKLARTNYCKHLVITWWEPMLQQNALKELVENLSDDWYIEIETNWTIKADDSLQDIIDQFNISLKRENAWVGINKSENAKVIMHYNNNKYLTYFKFVVWSIDDFVDVVNLVDKYDIENERVYIMPLWTEKEEILSNMPEIIELCIKHWFSYTTRLHVLAYGNKKGV